MEIIFTSEFFIAHQVIKGPRVNFEQIDWIELWITLSKEKENSTKVLIR